MSTVQSSYKPLPVNPPAPISRSRPGNKLRQTFLKTGIITEATGSAYIELQNDTGLCTKVISAVFGPRQLKKSSAFSDCGKVWCDFKYAPFARKGSRQTRLGQTEQERFHSRSVEKALHEVIRFETFPKAVLEVYILVLENDGSDFEAGVTCASAAIADAGVEMYDLVTAISAGVDTDGEIALDPASAEMDEMNATLSMAFISSSQKITYCSMVGHASEALTKKLTECCLDGCSQLASVVRTVLTS